VIRVQTPVLSVRPTSLLPKLRSKSPGLGIVLKKKLPKFLAGPKSKGRTPGPPWCCWGLDGLTRFIDEPDITNVLTTIGVEKNPDFAGSVSKSI